MVEAFGSDSMEDQIIETPASYARAVNREIPARRPFFPKKQGICPLTCPCVAAGTIEWHKTPGCVSISSYLWEMYPNFRQGARVWVGVPWDFSLFNGGRTSSDKRFALYDRQIVPFFRTITWVEGRLCGGLSLHYNRSLCRYADFQVPLVYLVKDR